MYFSSLSILFGVAASLACITYSGSVSFEVIEARKITIKIESPCESIHSAITHQIQPPTGFVFKPDEEKHRISWTNATKYFCEEMMKRRVGMAIQKVAGCNRTRDKRLLSLTSRVNINIDRYIHGTTNLIRGRSREKTGNLGEMARELLDPIDSSTNETLMDRSIMALEGFHSMEFVSPSSSKHEHRLREQALELEQFTWITNKMIYEMYAGAASFNAIADECHENRLATQEIGELIEKPEFALIDPEATTLLEVKVNKENNELEFIYTVEESPIGILRAWAIPALFILPGLIILVTALVWLAITCSDLKSEENTNQNAQSTIELTHQIPFPPPAISV